MHIGNPNVVDVLVRKYIIKYTRIVSFTSKYRRNYILWGGGTFLVCNVIEVMIKDYHSFRDDSFRIRMIV